MRLELLLKAGYMPVLIKGHPVVRFEPQPEQGVLLLTSIDGARHAYGLHIDHTKVMSDLQFCLMVGVDEEIANSLLLANAATVEKHHIVKEPIHNMPQANPRLRPDIIGGFLSKQSYDEQATISQRMWEEHKARQELIRGLRDRHKEE